MRALGCGLLLLWCALWPSAQAAPLELRQAQALLREAGFGPATHWTDERGWFSVFWAPAA